MFGYGPELLHWELEGSDRLDFLSSWFVDSLPDFCFHCEDETCGILFWTINKME